MDISDFVNVRTMKAIKNDLVLRIVDRRKKLKITQKALCSRSGVSYATIRKFEKTGEISLSSFFKISHALGFVIDFDKMCISNPITNLKDYDPYDN